MYGRMQFADFVVSHALQLNSRCLQALAGGGKTLSAKQLRNIRADLQRLASLWQMMHFSIGKPAYKEARRRVDRALALVPEGRGWVDRAARQIASKTDDEQRLRAVAMVTEQVVAGLPKSRKAHWVELDDLIQEESRCWRDDLALREVQDGDLIEHGITRAYEKSRRWSQACSERPDSAKRQRRMRRWMLHTVNHLELLQPALSDSSKANFWYLERLQANVEKQWLVQRFMDAADALADSGNDKPKARARVRKLADARIERLRVRSDKLAGPAFELGKKDFSRAVGRAVRKLALEEIVLLPLPAQASSEPEQGSG